ncbi:hypothetical protein D3C83_97320 [compost metagenome]
MLGEAIVVGRDRAGTDIGIGADATVYRIPPFERAYYDRSRSFHVFVHWQPGSAAAHEH